MGAEGAGRTLIVLGLWGEGAGPLGVSCKLAQILHHVYLEGGTDSLWAICASVLQDDFDLDYLPPCRFSRGQIRVKPPGGQI